MGLFMSTIATNSSFMMVSCAVLVSKYYSFRPKLFEQFDWNTNIKESMKLRNLRSKLGLNQLSNELFGTQTGVVNKKISWFDQVVV
jgi:hypothetical protein